MSKVKNPYLQQKILSASPEQLVCYIYDAGITACKQKNSNKAGKAIRELINALNFDYKEMAVPLFDLYRYCLSMINAEKYNDAQEILEGLRQAWFDAHLKTNSTLEKAS